MPPSRGLPQATGSTGGCVTSDPAIMMGKPVITGTRITVELILEKLSYGESIEQITSAHPHLTKKQILKQSPMRLK